MPFRSIAQNSHGQTLAQDDVACGFCRCGERSAPPHPCFHHVKGCGECHSPARTVLYTHSLTPGINDLGWSGIFQQKSFPPENADKAQLKSSGEGFYSIQSFRWKQSKAWPGPWMGPQTCQLSSTPSPHTLELWSQHFPADG